MTIQPNEAQKKALDAMQYSRDNRMLTVMPPGSGKTYLAALHAKEMRATSVLYIAHLREILDQARESFFNVYQGTAPENSFGHVDGQNKDFGAKFCFVSIQTLARPENFDKLMAAHNNHFDYVVVDEYHHARAKTYDIVINKLKGRFDHFLGITATPFRTDGKDVFAHVGGNVIFEMDLRNAIMHNYLVPFRYYGYFDDVNYEKVRWQGFNYNQKDLDKALHIDRRDTRIIQEYKNLGMSGKQTLGFCVSVKHAERMAIKFTMAGIKSAILSHKVNPKYRREMIAQFRAGKIRAIFTRDLFNEGIDFPEVECIVLLRPTVSKTLFYQQLGRGLRRKEGKKHVVVMDFIGNFRKNFEIQKMLTVDIGGEQRPIDQKPDFEYNIPTIHFQKELVDFWEEQAKKNQYVKNTILKAFKTLKDRLRRIPTRVELYDYTQYNISFYFGTYVELLRAAGEPEWLIKMIENPKPVPQQQIDSLYAYLKKSGKRMST